MTADEAGSALPSHSPETPARASTDGLELFHPLVARWFRERLGSPTDVQRKSWPRIAAGEHLLITAPTGSGKTLTAFLWALDRLVSGEWQAGSTRVLYVSPLKALNNDIRRNLLRPLCELRETFAAAAAPFPEIRVQTRSGDTPQPERRAMLRRPPEILITTPESLNLLLSSRGGIGLLGNVATVILDEVHSVVGNKRGVHAITAVERLVPLCGEFQRIALSATVRPLQTVAGFVGGLRAEVEGEEGEPRLRPRPVGIVQSADAKQYDIRVRFPRTAADEQGADAESVWPPLVEELSRIIAGNQSTLLFTNNRRLCEKLTLLVNDGGERPLAYAHHGSLSREIRETVERKLKDGELRAIVATASLELGIDIGALDEVVLVQSPHSIASGIQRIGRAGHDVGEVSRGTLYPTYSSDFIESAVMAAGVLSQDIEEVRPVDAPLDVLAQVVVSMVASSPGTSTRSTRWCAPRTRTATSGGASSISSSTCWPAATPTPASGSCSRSSPSTASTTPPPPAGGRFRTSTSRAEPSPTAATSTCASRSPTPASASSTRSSCGSARRGRPSRWARRAGASGASPTTTCS